MSHTASHSGYRSRWGIVLIVLSGLSLAIAPAWSTDKSLVLYLPFDEGSGTVANDASSYKNDGAVIGGAQWVQGHSATALEFVSGSHVTVPEIPQYDVSAQLSVMAWVKTSTVPNWCRVVDKSQYQTSGFDLVLTMTTGYPRLEFFVNNATSLVDGRTAVSDSQWHFIAATFGSKTLRVYVDGKLEGSSPSAVDINPNNLAVMVGGESSSDGGNQFFGDIDEVAMYNRELVADEILAVFQNGMPSAEPASGPQPEMKAADIPRDVVVTWKAGQYAATHDVYFGTVFDDVNAASGTDPRGVLASPGQDTATYDPTDLLAYGQTYYWRVDEVNAAPDFTIFKGTVWNFTSETYGYAVKPVKATASSSSTGAMGPDKTIDSSGLDAQGQHSTTAGQMWLSKKNQSPVWIQYEFDKVYKLHEMWVWNSNQATEQDVGFGAKDVTIETSLDGTTWTALEGVPEFAQATGEPNYVHNTTVEFGGAQAKYVRLTIADNWAGGTKQAGLAEVRFFYVPVKAYGPTPAAGATGVAIDGVLNWRPGREAVQHQVYLGTDPNALTLAKTVTTHSLALGSLGLQYSKAYYWRVNEVNDAATPSSWEGDVWSFLTPDYFVVDDFEAYNDKCNRVFFAWADGFGYSESASCGVSASNGNGTGSTVGNASAPFAEQKIVLSGNQSMPLAYDNTTGKGYSEAIRTLDPAQDWTAGGVKTLVLWFHGSSDNGAGQLYVKINGTRVDYTGNAAAITTGVWKQWNIDRTPISGLQAVKTLAIGVSGSGKGILYIDDILLYRVAPAVVVPADPGTAGLQAYYPLDGNANDSSGHGYNGTAMGNQIYVDAPAGRGKTIQLNGTNDYVDIPPLGTLVSTLSSTTLCTWVNYSGQGGNWQRIFDFGTGNTNYMMLSPHQTITGPMTFGIRVTTATQTVAEKQCVAPRTLLTGWHHVAVVIDGTSMGVRMYVDGTVVGSTTITVLPKDLGKTTQNWLGRSQFTTDAYLTGSLDDFRIYNRALSEGEVRYLAGDR